MKTVNKMKKVLFSNNRAYLKALKKKISDRYILLEAGQGKNINGNMFALLKEIEYKTPENTDLFKQSAIASIYTTSDLNKTCNIDINVAPLDFA